jgi:hypothetical protein
MNSRSHALLALLLLASPFLAAQKSTRAAQDALAPSSIRWISSTESVPWKQMTVEAASSSAQISTAQTSVNVLPSAKRIAVSGGPFNEIVAFANPDGSQVLEFENDSEQPLDATLRSGGILYRLHVPAKSMNTVTLSAQGIQRR